MLGRRGVYGCCCRSGCCYNCCIVSVVVMVVAVGVDLIRTLVIARLGIGTVADVCNVDENADSW